MERIMIANISNEINKEVNLMGWVHRVRILKSVEFIVLRDRSGYVQCVGNKGMSKELNCEDVIAIKGKAVNGKNNISSYEIQVEEVKVLNKAKEELAIEVNVQNPTETLDTRLNNRVLSLRQEKINSIFKIQATIAEGFREFLRGEGFIEMFTPKLVKEGAEGGTAVFSLDYFGEKAYLAQSPQFYKQMMVGAGYERVFEISHVYRAEEHDTNRHLNEYVSMDFEMGFIENEFEVMKMEETLLKSIMNKLNVCCSKELNLWEVEVPYIGDEIPKIKLKEAMEIVLREYGHGMEGDLDPKGEELICKYVKEKYNSEFVFITHYPRKKRPMYTMPFGEETNSFDLLFKGLEITTGGQRIHKYEELIENMNYKGLNPEEFEHYLETFKVGMPPHGGLAIGLERITCQLLGLKNLRETSLFPRDRKRLVP